ncbi:MAG: DUF2723 domain-containing protein [bacterium]|jgi:hypothetical protein|nr:DUF2723 domain-containing protein [candidate division KSB1 bacterium]MDH7558764.1 DUF2723 domain-containing protein [bacterium]
MDNHRKLNALVGGAVTLIAFLTYLRTIAPTVSFWDCGEFIACSYILGVPHPPGAPLYILLGRLFSMVPFAKDIAFRVNLISPVASALTVLFLYLIIVRMVILWRGKPSSSLDRIILYSSGAIGALAFAFTDSFWFNAVEAEVYALSMFFTAAVVWLIMKWMEKADDPRSDRYLLTIAYCVGLAIGVHLLNILALPFVFLIFYFRTCKPASFKEFVWHLVIASAMLGACAFVGLVFRFVYIGLAIYLVGHYFYWRGKLSEAGKRYAQLALTLGVGTTVFVAIYPGVIKGIPHLAEKTFIEVILLLMLALLIAAGVAVSERRRWVALSVMSLFLIVLGYSTYTALYIRSNFDPAIDENDPETAAGMVRYLNREQYGTWGILPRRFPNIPFEWEFRQRYPGENYKFYQFGKQVNFFLNYQLKKMYWRYFGWQFIGKGNTIGSDGYIVETISLRGLYALPFLIGLFGMVHHFFRDWKRALPVLVLFVMTGVAIVVYLNQEDPQPRERDYVYVGSFFAFAIWVGVGVSAILEWIGEAVKRRGRIRELAIAGAALVLLVAAPINLFAFNFHSHDRTGDYVPSDYSYNLLQTCDKDAIVFTNGDNDTFPLWFLQEVCGVRKDVRVVNLSLLNTDWYIRQLRDQEPKVPIRMSDSQIEALRPMSMLELLAMSGQLNEQELEGLRRNPPKKVRVSIPVPPGVYERDLAELGDWAPPKAPTNVDRISIDVLPTLMGQGIRVQDYMILRILYDNQWRRPVYFAVTVSNDNKLNLFNYLRMDGLCFKVVTVPGEYQIAVDRLRKNLFEVFRYRSLADPTVYFNDNVKGLLQNYRAAFLRLATEYARAQRHAEMLEALDKMEQVMPEAVIPVLDLRAQLEIAKLYYLGGRKDESERRLKKLAAANPDFGEAHGWLVLLYEQQGRYADAAEVLEHWVQKHPGDKEAGEKLDELRRKATEAVPDTAVAPPQDNRG